MNRIRAIQVMFSNGQTINIDEQSTAEGPSLVSEQPRSEVGSFIVANPKFEDMDERQLRFEVNKWYDEHGRLARKLDQALDRQTDLTEQVYKLSLDDQGKASTITDLLDENRAQAKVIERLERSVSDAREDVDRYATKAQLAAESKDRLRKLLASIQSALELAEDIP